MHKILFPQRKPMLVKQCIDCRSMNTCTTCGIDLPKSQSISVINFDRKYVMHIS